MIFPPSASSQTQRSPHVFYRHDLINQLQHNHALVTLVAENLSAYMETMRQFSKGTPPDTPRLDPKSTVNGLVDLQRGQLFPVS